MRDEHVKELRAQLEDHDEVVVLNQNGTILDVMEIQWNSRDGRVEIVVDEEAV